LIPYITECKYPKYFIRLMTCPRATKILRSALGHIQFTNLPHQTIKARFDQEWYVLLHMRMYWGWKNITTNLFTGSVPELEQLYLVLRMSNKD